MLDRDVPDTVVMLHGIPFLAAAAEAWAGLPATRRGEVIDALGLAQLHVLLTAAGLPRLAPGDVVVERVRIGDLLVAYSRKSITMVVLHFEHLSTRPAGPAMDFIDRTVLRRGSHLEIRRHHGPPARRGDGVIAPSAAALNGAGATRRLPATAIARLLADLTASGISVAGPAPSPTLLMALAGDVRRPDGPRGRRAHAAAARDGARRDGAVRID